RERSPASLAGRRTHRSSSCKRADFDANCPSREKGPRSLGGRRSRGEDVVDQADPPPLCGSQRAKRPADVLLPPPPIAPDLLRSLAHPTDHRPPPDDPPPH